MNDEISRACDELHPYKTLAKILSEKVERITCSFGSQLTSQETKAQDNELRALLAESYLHNVRAFILETKIKMN